jgi:hypothetical protein
MSTFYVIYAHLRIVLLNIEDKINCFLNVVKTLYTIIVNLTLIIALFSAHCIHL